MSDSRLQPLGSCCLLQREGCAVSQFCSLLPPTGDRESVTVSFSGTVDVTELKCSHFLLCFFFEMGETVEASWAHFTDGVTEAATAGGKLSQGWSLSESCVFNSCLKRV